MVIGVTVDDRTLTIVPGVAGASVGGDRDGVNRSISILMDGALDTRDAGQGEAVEELLISLEITSELGMVVDETD